MCGWKSPTRKVSDMDAMFSCIFDCAHAHGYNLYCAQGLPQGFSFKKKSVSGVGFIRGESVKEELSAGVWDASLAPLETQSRQWTIMGWVSARYIAPCGDRSNFFAIQIFNIDHSEHLKVGMCCDWSSFSCPPLVWDRHICQTFIHFFGKETG